MSRSILWLEIYTELEGPAQSQFRLLAFSIFTYHDATTLVVVGVNWDIRTDHTGTGRTEVGGQLEPLAISKAVDSDAHRAANAARVSLRIKDESIAILTSWYVCWTFSIRPEDHPRSVWGMNGGGLPAPDGLGHVERKTVGGKPVGEPPAGWTARARRWPNHNSSFLTLDVEGMAREVRCHVYPTLWAIRVPGIAGE